MKAVKIILVIGILIMSCKEKNKDVFNSKSEKVIDDNSEPSKKKPLSPHTSVMEMIGAAHIHIDYSSPGVRGRIIFGGLVGYDNVWQAGAHNATWIETNKDLIINDDILPKCKYGFFTIPSKEDWTIMINKNWNQHGKDDYDENDDVIRFKVKPSISDEIKEHLEYKIDKISETEGNISLTWEKVTISIPFKVNQ